MTAEGSAVPSRLVARVSRFGDPTAMVLAREAVRPPRGNEVVVRVTHASLGATDVLARRGGYVLQPAPGFITGYDFVGELVTESAVSVALGLRVGARVVAALPRMGAHATFVTVAPTLLVALPADLDPEKAAVLPLDGVTAGHALDLAGAGDSILVQGASGAVGMLAAQLALRAGRTVIGTASARSRAAIADLGIPLVDYGASDWPALVREAAGGGVDAAIDHTGSPRVREVLASEGVLVRTGFAGRAGQERADAVRGFARAARDRSERICSAPLFIATRRTAYRRLLSSLLADVAAGGLRTAEPVEFPLSEVWEAHRAAESAAPGRKVVLTMV
ncbi:Zinc-binding dehydrogenase [Leifsonia sp. 98AMF]|nr:Zinc-binding dehydrogenase [Leifsonia sp. 197AMF]SDJ35804.1 Zinc-binding dehydrogenase [Leifsonia sp. 466MF]SDK43707.1 Zinc-binding dehydrogenase [Leifsonia sp. 157MF]SDN56323.1 Zinc-binding dehydrogenase [Leifsonia sp. 509MF]SEN53421.1 Zinc-binding dehydrogenase [Leifsonia sp. 467MF]SFM77468.1 Zinc-binding dehydrogenase [Leifsonia sp. 98AMF]